MKITGSKHTFEHTINGKYRIVIERAASTTKDRFVLGYKVEANSDSIDEVSQDIATLKDKAEQLAGKSEAV